MTYDIGVVKENKIDAIYILQNLNGMCQIRKKVRSEILGLPTMRILWYLQWQLYRYFIK